MPVPGTLKKQKLNEDELVDLLKDKFQVDQETSRAYLWLVTHHEGTQEDLAETLGGPADKITELLNGMIEQGLIIRSAGPIPKYLALHPRMSMTNIFKVYEKELVQNLRDRRAVLDRIVYLLTPFFEEPEK